MNKNIKEYTPVGKKDCQGVCDREVIAVKQGVIIVCHGCRRIVMDNKSSGK